MVFHWFSTIYYKVYYLLNPCGAFQYKKIKHAMINYFDKTMLQNKLVYCQVDQPRNIEYLEVVFWLK